VGEAVEARQAGLVYVTLEFLCYAPELLTSAYALDLVEKEKNRGLPCYAMTEKTFISLADKENPQGIIAVARKNQICLDELSPQNFPWGVGLVSPQDPGNIGAIMRTIDAVGAGGLILLEKGADPTHPSSVRASMGTLFWHPVVNASFDEFIGWVRGQKYKLIGTSAHASQDYRTIQSYAQPLILLMGSEREGLTGEQTSYCDHVVRLPMHGRATSLNLAVTGGIMLYDVAEKMGVLNESARAGYAAPGSL
jgi:TrmH family RNA methyltransferase